MEERTDYQEQRMGESAIINEQITELMRVVCYDQVIYDDLRLESDEFLGLTLEVQPVPFFTSVRTDIERFYGDAVIQIIDNDGKTGKYYELYIQTLNSCNDVNNINLLECLY